MTTNKNGIISQLPDSSSSSDEQFYIGPEHLSVIEEKLDIATRAQEGGGEGKEERSVS